MKNAVKNKYKCPNPLWVKMSNQQAHFYNDLRGYTKKDIIPNKEVNDEVFDVISHNLAYLASALLTRYY
jgi:hypothetical protein